MYHISYLYYHLGSMYYALVVAASMCNRWYHRCIYEPKEILSIQWVSINRLRLFIRCMVLKTRCAHISGKAERERVVWRFFLYKFGSIERKLYLCSRLRRDGVIAYFIEIVRRLRLTTPRIW